MGAARLVLRDWSTGKLPRYAMPPPSGAAADGDPTLAAIYADDDAALLERLLPRKELRRSRDVVRLSSGRVDERALAFEAPWFGSATAGSESESNAEMEAACADEAEEASDGDESTESDAQQASVFAGNDGGGGGGGGDGNASDHDDVVEAEESNEHVNTDRVDRDGNEDGSEDEGETLGTTTRFSAAPRKLKLPSSSLSKPHVDPAQPIKKKVTFAAAAKTAPPRPSPKGRVPTKAAVAAADQKQKRKTTTADLARAPASMSKKAKIGSSTPARAPAAQGAVTRRNGSIKPVANAPTMAQKRKTAAASEEGMYDFSKFF